MRRIAMRGATSWTVSVAVAIAIAGCRSGRSILGTWECTGPKQLPDSTLKVTFWQSNKMSWVADSKLPAYAQHSSWIGTYRADRDELTFHFDNISTTLSGPPPAELAKMQRFNTNLDSRMKELMNERGTGRLTWISRDRFTVTYPKAGDPDTFTRVK